MSTLVIVTLALNLAVFGTHAIAPFRLARSGARARHLWARLALPSLLAACVVTLAGVWLRPDAASAWGLDDPIHGSFLARLIELAVFALALCDLIVAAGWRRLEPFAWRIVGVFGLLGAVAHALGSELLRLGWAPAPPNAELLAAAALQIPLALAAGELLASRPRFWCPLAGPALVAAAGLTFGFGATLGGAWWTLLAAALLLLLSGFAPPDLRRLTALAGLALAVLYLARAVEIARVLGAHLQIPDALLGP